MTSRPDEVAVTRSHCSDRVGFSSSPPEAYSKMRQEWLERRMKREEAYHKIRFQNQTSPAEEGEAALSTSATQEGGASSTSPTEDA